MLHDQRNASCDKWNDRMQCGHPIFDLHICDCTGDVDGHCGWYGIHGRIGRFLFLYQWHTYRCDAIVYTDDRKCSANRFVYRRFCWRNHVLHHEWDNARNEWDDGMHDRHALFDLDHDLNRFDSPSYCGRHRMAR